MAWCLCYEIDPIIVVMTIPSGHLVVDMCCHGDGELYNLFSFETQPSEAPQKDLQDSESSVRRYILPLGPDKKVRINSLHIPGCELYKIHL